MERVSSYKYGRKSANSVQLYVRVYTYVYEGEVGGKGANASIRKFIEYRRYFLARWELETKS